ncbi:cyanophycinase [Deinococcus soli (ex Cha et al. 2016)]|jgi:cyanophycinase|uniref:Cyanophycinase n=2 Tax=Deinococcus soli (ex Cha et al. 2016) TaxID=1309411 RepID=A0AAE4BM31_9DEIO|nr:cyanophycinase [Deinococcus soli (ex Cha et al. 2016)]MDR6218077.1 cyanophycinase [Deinococcus soli (ex Cha et al. 2016)]MDR6328327.1 cyanophycinase [Deinococcus soli (ex Cha et al. 2016)]MDR6751179.1 cyanophycinase [Deinococcus soli (ex Cha et al. 2016)]
MSAQRAGAKSGRGTLVIIGGHEDKEGARDILREVARLNGDRPLVIATLASHTREGYFESYQQGFADLGVGPLRELYLDERDDALQADTLDILAGAGGIFFSGGDQLRITSLLAQTPLDDRVRALYDSGGVIAGTSAGASVLCETMLVSGHSDETYRVGEVQMAPGLGLMQGVLIDQHFAERGRMGRLLGAVALNPRALGIGLDEDTAIVVRGTTFEVIGQGGVYVIDGAAVTHSNVAEAHAGDALSLHGTVLHVLSAGDQFDLHRRAPLSAQDRTREP